MTNLLIPMGGRGQRFRDAGYQLTKPLIDVNGTPMIQRVINNLGIKGRHIFLVNEEDCNQFNLKKLLAHFSQPNECVVLLEDPNKRQGAAAACLLAEEYINNDEDLFIANSDQLVEWSSVDFLADMQHKNADGGILTFTAHESKWSFAKTNQDGVVLEVAEKKVISDKATAGVYWYKHGKDFITGLKQMMSKNIRVNNEFYVCPVFNEIIATNKKIYDYPIAKMDGLGTPADLLNYLKK